MDLEPMNEAQPVHPGPKPSLLIGRLQIDSWQQWREWFSGNFNWKNFAFIEIAYEWEHYCEAHEIQLSLLGLCARITYWYGKDFGKESDDSASAEPK